MLFIIVKPLSKLNILKTLKVAQSKDDDADVVNACMNGCMNDGVHDVVCDVGWSGVVVGVCGCVGDGVFDVVCDGVGGGEGIGKVEWLIECCLGGFGDRLTDEQTLVVLELLLWLKTFIFYLFTTTTTWMFLVMQYIILWRQQHAAAAGSDGSKHEAVLSKYSFVKWSPGWHARASRTVLWVRAGAGASPGPSSPCTCQWLFNMRK